VTRRGETLELAVLGLLHERPVHGYELRKQLTTVLGWGRVLSYGSLYPALKKMSRAGWISEYVAEPPAKAPTTARGSAARTSAARSSAARSTTVSRRQRIVYELTALGNDRFTRLMADAGPASWEDDNFDVRFAFFGRTDRDIRLRILEGRRARLQERLSRAQQQLAASRARDTYTEELQRHGVESVEREVRWLSDLIAAERNDGRRGRVTKPTETT
jgi:DNA-binding PadR family transcriptional regulator